MSLIKVGSSVVKTDAFSNKYEVVTTTTSGVFNTNFDISSATVVVYVDGVRQQASAYSVSGARQITLSETVVSGTSVAITAMDTSPVTNLAAKANLASPHFTGSVGIGTESPSSSLHVYEAAGAAEILDGNATSNPFISFRQSDVEKGYLQYTDAGAGTDYIALSAPVVSLQPNGGNVGIGKVNPSSALDVNGQVIVRNTGVSYDLYNYGSSFTVEDTLFGNGNGKLGSDGKVGIGTVNPGAKLDVNGGLNIAGRMQIWRWTGNMSASSTIRLLDHTGQWIHSYCMVFVKVQAGWQNSAIWDVFCDGYGTYSAATKKMGDGTNHSVTTSMTNNYGYINLNNLHTAQVSIEVNVYSFSSYSIMNYTSSYMTLA